MKIDHLAEVQKPARYTGGEWGMRRPKDSARLRFIFAYPETYEVGMSYLGLQILYDLLNSQANIWCERVFAPWLDRERKMREGGESLCSLESGLPVKEADVIGFSLQHELVYTNVLLMLDLAGLPLRSSERDETHPLVIAGGPCTCNPAPMSAFIDAYVIGEAEEVVLELTDHIIRSKNEAQLRLETLRGLARIPGVFVPSLYERTQNRLGEICFGPPIHEDIPRRVRKRIVSVEKQRTPTDQLVPSTRIAHHRLSMEIMRGCARGCRFCQAGFANRPLRERAVSSLLEDATKTLEATGHDEISLLSLSTGDYSRIKELTEGLLSYCEPRRIAMSLPSLRLDGYASEISRFLERIRGGGMTFAPEAGTERLRRAINKPIADDAILQTIRNSISKHWSSYKLYFMVGLPSEAEEDIRGIIDLSSRIRRELNEQGWRRGTLHVSVGAFSPKPHTPYQWCGQISLDEIRRRLKLVRSGICRRGIKVSTHDVEPSVLEAILARGDIRQADVIETAYRGGARFDEWSESFQWEIWLSAFDDAGMSHVTLAEKTYQQDDLLPWNVIDLGLDTAYLWREYQRTFDVKPSRHCGEEKCRLCGVCDGETWITVRAPKENIASQPADEARPSETFRYRLRYEKRGSATWLSHQDLIGTMNSIFRRAGVRLAFSKGFHPHPKFVFGGALSVGIEGVKEYLDISTEKPYKTVDLIARLNAVSPEGIKWTGAWPLDVTEGKITSIIQGDEYRICWDAESGETDRALLRAVLEELGVSKAVDEENGVRIIVPRRDGGAPGIMNMVEVMREKGIVPAIVRITRTEQYRTIEGNPVPVTED